LQTKAAKRDLSLKIFDYGKLTQPVVTAFAKKSSSKGISQEIAENHR